jgi:formate-dependent nitrite reductase membrane component NrfD
MGQPRRVYDAPVKGILWGWEVSAYVVTKAVSAGAILVALMGSLFRLSYVSDTTLWWALGLGLFFLMATGALLVKDLDRPDRFLNVLLRPQWKSWLVRGGYTISIFGGLMALLAALMFFDLKGGFTPVLYGITLAAATMTAIYTAFLFAQAKGRDFWQSPSLALHMLVHSFMAGAAVFLIVNLITNEGIVWTDYLRNT